MAFVQKIGAAINPYASLLPTSMQQSAQQQAGRQFLGGLAQNFLAAAGPSRYPVPTVAGLAGINPAIQSAQQTQNVAVQNAINAQNLQSLKQKHAFMKQLLTPAAPPRPSVNLAAPTGALPIPPQLANSTLPATLSTAAVNMRGPSIPALNLAQQQRATAQPAAPRVTGAPTPSMGFNMFGGPPGGINRQAIAAEYAGLPKLATALHQSTQLSPQAKNAKILSQMPDVVPGPNGQLVPNAAKAQFAQMITPVRRVVAPAEKKAVDQNYKAIDNLQTTLRDNRDILNVLSAQEAFINATDKSEMGPGTAFVGRLKDFADSYFGEGNKFSLGLGSTASQTVRGAMESLFTQMMFTQTQKLKGAISEKEMTAAGTVGPSINDPKKAALAKVKVQRILMEKAQKVSAVMDKRMRAMGAKKYNEMISTNPFFIDNMIDEIGELPDLDVTAAIKQVIADANKEPASPAPVITPAGTTGSR